MQQELINQAITMFDTSEKWSAFLELSSLKDDIKRQWYEKLKKAVRSRFWVKEETDQWTFSHPNNIYQDFRWYLTEFGSESLGLRTCDWIGYGLWVNPSCYNSQEIFSLLHNSKYSRIMDLLRQDISFPAAGQDWILQEQGNFNFESPYDTHFTVDSLSWFAGNKTEELTDQIVEKIDCFRKDELITSLFAEINDATKL